MDISIPDNERVRSVYRVAKYRPLFTVGVVLLSIVAAILEGIGLGFILPIIELAQTEAPPENATGLLGLFVSAFFVLGIPFELGYLVLAVSGIMTARFTMSFFVSWLKMLIRTKYVAHLRDQAFTNAMNARIAYFDSEGSDDILNSIITESTYAGRFINWLIDIVQQAALALMYVAIAIYLAPVLTIGTALVVGVAVVIVRSVIDSGYEVGGRVAEANEDVQSAVQTGTQGIRDVKLFRLNEEIYSEFQRSLNQLVEATIRVRRNQAGIRNAYELVAALSVFVLIFLALQYTSLTLGTLGVFLFAILRLAPTFSHLSSLIYKAESDLPHLVRMHNFIRELEIAEEPDDGSKSLDQPINTIEAKNLTFSYDDGSPVLKDVSFKIDRGEFVAFVGPSGAGKSTVASILARLYEPEKSTVFANGTDITDIPLQEWRSKISMVRQDPHIFNETLRKNITIANRDATDAEVREACEIAQVEEFIDDLPEGYQTVLGDNGVRLSGGQKQRIAIARSVLDDCDLLIFDEATSDLDTELERKVHTAIESMDSDLTMLVIAHRLSTVTNANCIYTMEDGEIVERGTHSELVDTDSRYAKLYAMQSSS